MITTKELNEVTLSPTKKDYYQIWNELLDLATKISTRWSPESTNESDPGIVLLKALTAIADKLNYNIDKNTLEAFMPSATQDESMRKLTEMMGYSMKYYQAATCDVNFSFKETADKSLDNFKPAGIYFPRFINLKNKDEDINYVTLEEFTLSHYEPSRKIKAAEGMLRDCETDNDNIVSMMHLDDNFRYYFPESNVAENCIFITNISSSSVEDASVESADWQKVTNLNTQLLGSKIYKFGYDSRKQLPYVQFPEDIQQLIKDGLRIRYISTNGVSGNISARMLTVMELPAIWSTADSEDIKNLSKEDFSVNNVTAATNGANPESINAAYNNYKKTIGTFDTLVTCRDYMNKIYQLTQSEVDTTPLVSNIIVSDIRDDINRAVTLCSFDEYGICYSDHSLKAEDETTDLIENFDLVLYPFKTSTLNTKASYLNSFKYSAENNHKIEHDLTNCKTIAHSFINPAQEDIYCIKNYLRLKARITTIKKVTATEEANILDNIFTAIYTNFNARHIDFGEEIPYDSILEVVKAADYRIKEVNLEEPALYTKICDQNEEYDIIAVADGVDNIAQKRAKELYNQLALRNILAGRIAAFQYSTDFEANYSEKPYNYEYTDDEGKTQTYSPIYPQGSDSIIKLESEFCATSDSQSYDDAKGLKLLQNQVVQFRMPSFKTIKTYPSYVNYYLKLNIEGGSTDPIPATFMSLRTFMASTPAELDTKASEKIKNFWQIFLEDLQNRGILQANITKFAATEINSNDKFKAKADFFGCIFTVNGSTITQLAAYDSSKVNNCYYFELKPATLVTFSSWVRSVTLNGITLSGLFKATAAKLNNVIGAYVNANLEKFIAINEFTTSITSYLDRYYVQQTHAEEVAGDTGHTVDGLGRNGEFQHIPKDAEYQLGANEYLLINYTNTSKDSADNEHKTVINEYYGPGTILKPSFKLTDSELYHKAHSYSKKDGFYFADQPSCAGMFTLGTDEQICIRKPIQVELDEYSTHLYWELNSDDKEALTNYFTFDEDYGLNSDREDANGDVWVDGDGNDIHNAYTLKAGEHIYYTDAGKSDLAYFGAGTVVVRSKGTDELIKYNNTETEVTEEDIMEYGLAAGIPWRIFHLNKQGDTYRKITLIEHQYVSLTEGDHLLYLDSSDAFSTTLNNKWKKIPNGATYKLAEDESEVSLPMVNIENTEWQARSRLDFNMGKEVTQVLHQNESLKIYLKSDPTKPITVKPTLDGAGKLKEVHLNSNYLCQAALDTLNVTKVTFNDVTDFSIDDFKIKLSDKQLPAYEGSGTNTMLLDNYSNGNTYYTKLSFASLDPTIKNAIKADSSGNHVQYRCCSLNIDIGTNKCGLIMFYYIDQHYGKEYNYDSANEVYVEVPTGNFLHVPAKIIARAADGSAINIGRFNSSTALSSSYNFVPGMQVIEIPKEATSLEIYVDTDAAGNGLQSTLIFSRLAVVQNINPKLNYHRVDYANCEDAYEQLLSDIKDTQLADSFYYNCPVDQSNAIELNSLINDETLASPYIWYDKNNLNNKFVISEIDADYLKTGITLTRMSRV